MTDNDIENKAGENDSATEFQNEAAVRRAKLEELQKTGRDPYTQVRFDARDSAHSIIEGFENYQGKSVSIAGRILSKRAMGKASFCDIHDSSGKIQIYVRIDEIGEDAYEDFKKYDIGDIVGLTGEVFKTHKGEISVKAKSIILLSKSLLPLPEKWHGLKDTDLRYRQRYLDLIVNPEVRETFIKRSKIIKSIRAYLDSQGFMEVDTPLLNSIPGGAAARPFITHHNTLDIDLYLRISPELYLKRLIVGGIDKVYEMGRMFRNEGISIKHNPEFSELEIYQAYTDYLDMMELTQNLFKYVAEDVLGKLCITYQGQEIDLSPPWPRMTMTEAVTKYAGVNFDGLRDFSEAVKAAETAGLHVPKELKSKGEVLNLMFEHFAEKNFIQPTIIYDYPVELSPLTKRKPGRPDLVERFEVFTVIGEMGNAYTELNDPIDQRGRFDDQMMKRAQGDAEANMADDDFVTALEYGMPPTGGLGIGIDRMIMLLTDSYSIRDILLFPTLKPVHGK